MKGILLLTGLRAGGIRTCAKTTGTLARMTYPDGNEYLVHRPARANVNEQFRIVRAAVRAKAEALVVEYMPRNLHGNRCVNCSWYKQRTVSLLAPEPTVGT